MNFYWNATTPTRIASHGCNLFNLHGSICKIVIQFPQSASVSLTDISSEVTPGKCSGIQRWMHKTFLKFFISDNSACNAFKYSHKNFSLDTITPPLRNSKNIPTVYVHVVIKYPGRIHRGKFEEIHRCIKVKPLIVRSKNLKTGNCLRCKFDQLVNWPIDHIFSTNGCLFLCAREILSNGFAASSP